jgi:PAS domain S-box-containing protein
MAGDVEMRPDTPLTPRWARLAPPAAGGFGIALGIAVLIGWAAGVGALKSVFPGLVEMKANTAACFVILGVALVLLAPETAGPGRRRVGRALALGAALVGLVTLGEFVFGRTPGIDQVLFREPPGAVDTAFPGRMALATLASFIALGGAVALLNVRNVWVRRLSDITLAAMSAFCLMTIMAYVYGMRSFYLTGGEGFTPMAFNSAAGFLVLAFGTRIARPTLGVFALAIKEGPAGVIVRRLGPGAIVSLFALGYLHMIGERNGHVDVQMGISLLVVGVIVIAIVSVGVTARAVDRAESTLRRVEDERRLYFRLSLDMLCVANLDGYFIQLNPAWEKTLGWSVQELMAKPFIEFVHPEDREATIAEAARLGLGAETVSFENRYRCKDGSYRWLLWSTAGVPERGVLIAAARDITERTHAETERQRLVEEVREQAQRVGDLYNNAPVGYHSLGPDGLFLEINDTELAWLGYTRDEVIAKKRFTDLTTPEGVRTFNELFPVFKEQGYIRDLEIEMVRKDGTAFPVLINSTTIADEAGNFLRSRSTAVDITQRRSAENALRRSETFLESVVENIPAVVFVKDADSLRFVSLNRAGEETLGHRREDVIGKTVHELFSAEQADVFTSQDREVLESGRQLDIPEEPNETKTGIRYLHTRKVPVLDERGRPRYLLGISEDITELKTTQEKLLEAKEEAERANRAKDAFLSRTSHELRTPLNAILGFAQLLEMDDLSEEQKESARRILTAGRHLMSFVDETLDISRIESGTLTLSLEPVEVSAVVRESLDLIRPLADERGVTLQPQQDGGFHVMADRRRLEQVVVNLLSNAVKFNREEGEVRVTWELCPDERVRLHVEDQGPGIPADQMDRVFAPFDRLGAERLGVQGTGLGLTLSQGLMEAMGGAIDVESVIGRGSVFTVSLASAEAPGSPHVEGEMRLTGSERAAGNRTILHIEDNPANLKLVERILERLPGASLLSAMQAHLGLELARKHRPDLILLDLHLPDMSGVDALRALRGDPTTSDIPVVVLSADAVPGTARGLLDAGATDYVTKPFDVPGFLKLLGGILGDG